MTATADGLPAGPAGAAGQNLAQRIVRSLVAAPVIAVTALVNILGGAALAFPTPLDGSMSTVIGAMLAGTIAANLATMALASLRTGLMECQEAPALLLGLMAGIVYMALPPEAGTGARIAAVVATFAAVTMLTGLFLFTLGALKLGEFVRYIPFPVIGGVLAGLGYLIARGGLSVATGLSLEGTEVLHDLSQPGVVVRWLPALAFGAVLFVAAARVRHFLTVPVLMAAATAVFYGVVWLSGTALAEIETAGWLLGPFPGGSLFTPVRFGALADIGADTVWRIAPTVLSAILVSTIGLLLHATSLELALREDVDLDRELRACGVGAMAGGLCGTVPAFHSVSGTLLLGQMDARQRATIVLVLGLFVFVLIFGGDVLSLMPRPVLGGLVMFVGGSLLWEWLVQGFRNLPRGDWLVVLVVVLTVAAVGYMQGILLSVLAGVVLFQVGYSKIEIVKHALSGADAHSSLERADAARTALHEHGGSTHVLQLQGFLFFGTANGVVKRTRERLGDADAAPLRRLILDFTKVQGIDWAAINSFRKILQIGEAHGVRVAVTAPRPAVLAMLTKAGVIAAQDEGPDAGGLLLFDTLDHGLEGFENELLADLGVRSGAALPEGRFPRWVEDAIGDRALRDRLRGYLTTVEIGQGDALIRQGEKADALYFVQAGQASVYVDSEEGPPLRVKSYLAGSVVGEIGLYLSGRRTATVRAESDLRALRLSRSAFERMRDEDPTLAARFHEVVVRLLGTRLSESNRLLAAYNR